ncbi:citrate synthase 2 [Mycobacterium tuberculosis variant bovis BCG]|nr:citrate synthase 2 [Mycobacterium tuberculosis variant bovis BCG]
MTVVPENFVPGLDGVVAFTTEIAEPDKDGGPCATVASTSKTW